MSSIQEYWEALPKLTRGYLTLVIGTTILSGFGFINPFKVILIWQSIISNLELWRLFTNFLYFGKPSFMLLMQLMIIGRFGSGYENDPFRTGQSASADFLFSVLFNATLLLGLAYVLNRPILGPSLVFAFIYLWSRRNPESPVSVWGFRFTGSQLPWVFLVMNTLMGNDPVPDLMGLATAHLYYFLIEVLPLKTGNDYLSTPTFVSTVATYITGEPTITVTEETNANPWSQSQEQSRNSGSGGHSWGTGQRLGGN